MSRFRLCAALMLFVALIAAPLDLSGAQTEACSPTHTENLSGELVVAGPTLSDPNFWHTVVFIAEHNGTGAFGLVVNRPVGRLPIATLIEAAGVPEPDVEGDVGVYYGGPVESELGFVLHSTDYADETTVKVNERFALSSGLEILRALAEAAGPERSLFALGYAGWGAGQLESEIRRGDWYTIPADEALIYDIHAEEAWVEAASRGCFEI